MPLIIVYWKECVMALLLVAVGVFYGLWRYERTLVIADNASIASYKQAEATCISTNKTMSVQVDAVNKEVSRLQAQTDSQAALLERKDKDIIKREDRLQHELVLAKNIPKGCEEGAKWFITQVSSPQFVQ